MAAATDGRKAGLEAAPSPGSPGYVPTLAESVAGIQAWLKAAGYDSVSKPTFTWEMPDGRPGSLPLNFKTSSASSVSAVAALTGECRELADDILAVLTDAGPGVLLKGIDIAAKISDDCDHTGGTWGRAIKALKADGVIVSGTAASGGYCLIVTG